MQSTSTKKTHMGIIINNKIKCIFPGCIFVKLLVLLFIDN